MEMQSFRYAITTTQSVDDSADVIVPANVSGTGTLFAKSFLICNPTQSAANLDFIETDANGSKVIFKFNVQPGNTIQISDYAISLVNVGLKVKSTTAGVNIVLLGV